MAFQKFLILLTHYSISKACISACDLHLKTYRSLVLHTHMHTSMCIYSLSLSVHVCVCVYVCICKHTYNSLRNVLLMFYFLKVCTSHHFFPPRTVYPHSRHDRWKGGRKNKRLVCWGQSAFLLTLWDQAHAWAFNLLVQGPNHFDSCLKISLLFKLMRAATELPRFREL